MVDFADFDAEFAEVDPTGRYGRYDEVLGKGASKTVYRAFDEYEGIEVAWNQVKLYDFLQSPEDLERLYCEIHLLKTLNHENIMKFYTSWVDVANRNINFVTEMFTSGTLRQYRLKHRRVNIRAVKHWCRQILKGLLYLHSLNPPVIHRDLKCDNIFINGNQGEVKIGDLGLAAILRKSHAARCVGTPEFMAPEVYREEYNELVDIYSFGMCILEMVTFEYPYSECTHPAEIYKKVISGKKPDSLYKVEDPEVRKFIEKCLATVSERQSARELLQDPFLQTDDFGYDLATEEFQREIEELGPPGLRKTLYNKVQNYSDLSNGDSQYQDCEPLYELDYDHCEFEPSEMAFFASHDEPFADISIKGRRREDDGIFLRLRIVDKDGKVRNIYFPFDIETDTALSVANEMIIELDLKDQDVTKIADMIDTEIASIVSGWTKGLNIIGCTNEPSICQNCVNAPIMDYASPNNLGAKNLQVLNCSKHGCAAVHGRFEEITYQVEGSDQCDTEGAPVVSSQSDDVHYADIWGQRDGQKINSHGTSDTSSPMNPKQLDQSGFQNEDQGETTDSLDEVSEKCYAAQNFSAAYNYAKDSENEIRQELRWLKAKYQMQLRELRDQQMGSVLLRSTSSSPTSDIQENRNFSTNLSLSNTVSPNRNGCEALKALTLRKHLTQSFSISRANQCANEAVTDQSSESIYMSFSPERLFTAKSFYTGGLIPSTLHRATSLPVDAVDV